MKPSTLSTQSSTATVRVKPTDNHTVITVSSNPEYGWITVTQERTLLDDTGFIRPIQLHAFIKGKIKDLRALKLRPGAILPGKIVIQEQLTPFSAKMPEKDLKVAGKTGITCCLDDQPIYRRTRYTEDADAIDHFVGHNNGPEIKARYLEILHQESLAEQTDDPNLQKSGLPAL